jgi:hypothetical protein
MSGQLFASVGRRRGGPEAAGVALVALMLIGAIALVIAGGVP